MGLPESGLGSSLRRTCSDVISKGIRKSTRKPAKPSSALRKLRFGDEVPEMLPAPEMTVVPIASDPSISPSKGNVANLVKTFEEEKGAVSLRFDVAGSQIDYPQSYFGNVEGDKNAMLPVLQTGSPSPVRKPRVGYSAMVVAGGIEESNSGILEAVSRDDTAAHLLHPLTEDALEVSFEDPHDCPVPPLFSANPLTKPLQDLSPEQAMFLDVVEAQPLSSLPVDYIPVIASPLDSSLLPSNQCSFPLPSCDVDKPALSLTGPQNIPAPFQSGTDVEHSDSYEMEDEGTTSLAHSDFPPLKTNQPFNTEPTSDKPSCWDTGQQKFDLGHGTSLNQAEEMPQQPESVVPSFAQLFKAPVRTGGPVAFDVLVLKDIGSIEHCDGKPMIKFSHADTSFLTGRLGFALVGKFSHSIPSPFYISKALGNIKLAGSLSWKFLNANHILIKLTESCDYVKLLNGVNELPVWFVSGCPMRVFPWTPTFHPSKETPVVAVWCKLPGLPVHLYDHSALFKIGSLIGKPLQLDSATAHRERASFARICVEIDITKHVPDLILLDINGSVFNQRVIYENLPKYCIDCHHVGHSVESCYAKGNNPRPLRRVNNLRGDQIQHAGPPKQVDGLSDIHENDKPRSDGFQTVYYKKRQNAEQVGKSQKVSATPRDDRMLNRFTSLADDMDTSETGIQDHLRADKREGSHMELGQTSVGNRLQSDVDALKALQGKAALGVEDVEMPDQATVSRGQTVTNKKKNQSVLVYAQSPRSKMHNTGSFQKIQQGVKIANKLTLRIGRGKDISERQVKTALGSGGTTEAVEAFVPVGLEQQLSGHMVRQSAGELSQAAVGDDVFIPAAQNEHHSGSKQDFSALCLKYQHVPHELPHAGETLKKQSAQDLLEESSSVFVADVLMSAQQCSYASSPTRAATCGEPGS